MLKSDGIVEENGARGLHVAPIESCHDAPSLCDPLRSRSMRLPQRSGRDRAKGDRTIAEQAAGWCGRACSHRVLDVAKLVAADIGFHRYMYEASATR